MSTTANMPMAFLLLGALRALAVLAWRFDQLEATTPGRLNRNGGNDSLGELTSFKCRRSNDRTPLRPTER